MRSPRARGRVPARPPSPFSLLPAQCSILLTLSLLQAAACGLPMLVTPVNGARELIEDGRNGFLITPDAQEIATRLNLGP